MSSSSQSLIPDDWVALAVFAQPHGVSGRIKVKSLTDAADDFSRHPILTDEKGNPLKLTLTGHAQGMAIVSVEGITRREQAELLRGKKIGIARTALPAPAADAYYVGELVGIEAVTEQGERFGTVSAVLNYGASDILEITKENGKTELYAFTHATFPSVDMATRRITIIPPDILGAEDDEE